MKAGRFVWSGGEPLDGEWSEYAERAGARIEEDEASIEIPVGVKPMLAEMDRRLGSGSVVTIDYGYTEPELRRFPSGTLMSYRRHQASPDVLDNPGEQDITAHVPFSFLMENATLMGWHGGQLRTLARWAMEECGELECGRAIDAGDEAARVRLGLQLKTILFGMGESFRVAEWKKAPLGKP